MEIMKLIPTGKDYLWGGTRLREEYGKKIDLTPLAETWECSVHPDGPSYVANGTYKGKTLGELCVEKPGAINWYIESYHGKNNALRAGAKLLLAAAEK